MNRHYANILPTYICFHPTLTRGRRKNSLSCCNVVFMVETDVFENKCFKLIFQKQILSMLDTTIWAATMPVFYLHIYAFILHKQEAVEKLCRAAVMWSVWLQLMFLKINYFLKSKFYQCWTPPYEQPLCQYFTYIYMLSSYTNKKP